MKPAATFESRASAPRTNPRRARWLWLLVGCGMLAAFAIGWRYGAPRIASETEQAQLASRPGAPAPAPLPAATVPVATDLPASSPGRDLARMLRERDQLRREFELSSWAARLTTAEFPGVARELANLPEHLSHAARKHLLARWSRIDPRTAMDVVNLFGGALDYRITVLEGWIRLDAPAAFRWVEANPSIGNSSNFTLFASFTEVLLTSGRLDEAREFLRRIPDGNSAAPAQMIARAWGRQNPAAALQWVDTLPRGKLRDEALRGALGGVTETEPEMALQFALANSDPKVRSQSMQSAAFEWARRDPQAAVAWVNRQPGDVASDTLRVGLLRSVGANRPELVPALLDGFNSPDSRGVALQNYGQELLMVDPLRACDRLLSLPLHDDPTNVVASMIRIWQRTHPTEAAQFLNHSPRLTEVQRQRIRELLAGAKPRQ